MLWSDNSGAINNEIYYPRGIENEDFIILSDHNRSELSISKQRIETRQRMINATMRSYHIDDKLTISTSWENLPSRSYSTLAKYNSSGQLITESKTANFAVGQNTVTVNNNINILQGMKVYGPGIGNDALVSSILNNEITLTSPNTADGTGQTIYFTPFEYTVDGGAGGVQILDWYETHSGPFWVYLSYDKYNAYKISDQIPASAFQHLNVYNEIKLMYFGSFDYTVIKRGIDNFDFWNISVTLEEA